jgi:hypothetical protein
MATIDGVKQNQVEAANRYDGIGVGPRLEYSYEAQPGIPIDGTNALLRQLSPFTLRLLPPNALITAAAEETGAYAVDLITAAATASDQNGIAQQVSQALQRVSPLSAERTTLQTFVSEGQFLADAGSTIFPTIADAAAAADIALQLQRILEVPPLTLLVNPKDMTISYTSVQNYSTRTRQGFVFERWGEEQPVISFSGSTGAFIAGVTAAPGTDPYADQARRETSSVSGVQFASKRDSAAWQNLMALFHFYRNNGYIYNTVDGSEAHHFIGAVAIDYDQKTYVGHINSFEYTYEEGIPHRIEWTMEFTVNREYDNAASTSAVAPQRAPTVSPSDPKYVGSQASPRGISDILSAAERLGATTTGPEEGTIPFELLE